MRPRSTSGQASVEYLALVALVALVFAIAGAFTLQGRAIAGATLAQLRRGLCIVEGHDCADLVAPCSLSSRGSGRGLNLDVGVVRLAGGSFALIDRRSDGRVQVTLTDHLDGGLSAGVGGMLKIGGRPAVGAELRAGAIASRGRGSTYEVADDRQAQALLRLHSRPRIDPNLLTPAVRAYWRRVEAVLPRIPAPVASYRQLEGRLSLAGAVAGAQGVAGVREDRGSGRRTYYLQGSLSLDGEARLGASGAGSLAVTVDRSGRPVDLAILGSGALERSRDLPAMLQPVAGHITAGRGRTWELEGHLDLTQAGGPAVAELLSTPARLLRLMLGEGSVQLRSYGTSQATGGLSGRIKAGVGLGAGFEHTTTSQRLLMALDHTREGFWVPRYDCTADA